MEPLASFLECFGRALCDRGRRAWTGERTLGELLPDVAKSLLDLAHQKLTTTDIATALGQLASTSAASYEALVEEQLGKLARLNPLPFRPALQGYLQAWPATVRQVLRRPSSPLGHAPPEGLTFYKPDDLLLFLPPRAPRFAVGDQPPHLDDWQLTEFLGFGECSEVWLARSESHPELSPACLKFIVDSKAAAQVVLSTDPFVQVFDLNEEAGIVPLRSVYQDAQPPAIESSYVYGYDLTGLLHEWRWRYNTAKPLAVRKLMIRLCEILALAHRRGIVHRDLKPSNILFHPRASGRFTLWITDFGWGSIAAARSMELTRGGTPKGEQHRLELRGAHTPLYACPQLAKAEPAHPRDDIHALGAIWYQLLKRSPSAAPPIGTDWAEEFLAAGLTEAEVKLLLACVSTRPEKRPNDAQELLNRLLALTDPREPYRGSPPHTAVSTSSSSGGALETNSKPRGVGVSEIDAANQEDGSRTLPLAPHSGDFYVGVRAQRVGGTATAAAPVVAMAKSGHPRTLTNSLGMVFSLIPPGSFIMGSPEDEPGHRPHELPLRQVNITRAFYVAVTPVTQAQYEAVMGYNPSRFRGQANWPVESVSWHEAVQFCERLEEFPAEADLQRSYRLPTEAEWEYACRAGESMPFFFGQKLSAKQAWFASQMKERPTSPTAVGRFPPNAWGLHDMHGNVSEWVSDWYAEGAYWDSVSRDPQGPDRGSLKVCRGGCWLMFAAECRSATRRAHDPHDPADTIGFRVVLSLPSRA